MQASRSDPPRPQELGRRVWRGVPALSHSHDAAVFGEQSQLPGRVASRVELARAGDSPEFEDALFDVIHG